MARLSLHFLPLLPAWLVLLLLAAFLALLVQGSRTLLRRDIPRRSVLTLALLRIAIIVIFVLVLLQPVVSYTRTVEKRPEALVLIDVSASMADPGATEDSSRLEQVLEQLNGGLVQELATRFELRWFTFDRTATVLEDRAWAALPTPAHATHYADSLNQAWRLLPAAGGTRPTPQRVLLVSDGLDRGGADIVETARRLGVAIDVLAPGSPPVRTTPAPIRIADVQAARRVLLGSETNFLVTLRTDRPGDARTVNVRLAEGDKELQTVTATLEKGRTEVRVPFAHRPGAVGTQRYEFRGADGPVYPLSVQVVDGKHEVLVLEDTWRWEFKFLRRVLEEDPSFRFTAILSRGGGAFMQFAAPDRRAQLVGLPQDRAQLALFDTVIVGDVNPTRWPRDFAASLRRLVVEDGKSLVVIAGPNLGLWNASEELLGLLPVEVTRETANPVAGPLPVRLTVEGATSPFFARPGGGQVELPALDQIYPPLRKKPAATVLLEAASLRNVSGPLIVVAEHTVGRGRVLYVGTDTLWKWQTLTTAADASTTPYQRFWQQSLRALAPVRGGGGAVNLWLQPQRGRYETGQRASVRAEIDTTMALAQPTIRGVVSLPDGRTLPLNFTADPTAPNAYRTEFETNKVGAYRLTASLVSGGRTLAEGSATVDVDEARGERDGAAVDRANLERIAAATGGKVIDPADASTWPASATATTSVSEQVTLDLWNRSILLVLLALVAGLDWLIRLLRGYV